MERLNRLLRRVPVWLVYALGSLPALWLGWRVVGGDLGPDPARTMERALGLWALRFLTLALAVSPLRRLGLNLLRFRRALGLLAFFYAAAHLLTWAWPDMGLRFGQMAEDLAKRPYLLLGMLAFAAMLPLALTSTDGAIRRMGAAAWGRLHRLAYPALALGVLHFVILSRVWTTELVLHAAAAGVVLLVRLWPKAASGRRLAASGR